MATEDNTNTDEVIELDREVEYVSVRKPDKTVERYEVREMSGKERDAWMNQYRARMNINEAGLPTGIKEFDNHQASLIVRCLYNQDGKQVPLSEIEKFPVKAQAALHKVCEKVNALGSYGEKAGKKD